MPVKELRKAVLLSLQLDIEDKSSKKKFKKCVQALEADGRIKLGADGIVKLSKSARKEAKESKRKKNKDKKDKKKRKKSDVDDGEKSGKKQKSDPVPDVDGDDDEPPMEGDAVADNDDYGDPDEDEAKQEADQGDDTKDDGEEENPANKNLSVKGNPIGATRLFLGNLPFAVDETSLNDFLGGHMTHVKWITDKETGRFYGSAFAEMRNSRDAAEAVARAGTELMGRPIKVNFAPARSGDIWPPKQRVSTGGKQTGGGGGQAGGYGTKAMSEKPKGCTKLFIGNLSYDIDDDAITKFFANVDAELKAVRWLHHKDTGDFKGV